MILLEAILNRLRGTGVLKHFGTLRIGEMKIWKLTIPKKEVEIKLVWNHVYGLYLALIVGLLSMNIYAGLLTLVAYLIGESKGWGEWIGALTRWESKDEEWLNKQYKDNEGKKFPFVHQIANFIEPEVSLLETIEDKIKQYMKYATVALVIRGIYWFGLVYGVMFAFGLINLYEYILITLALGFGFPLACYIGKNLKYNGKIGIINYSRGWENQELIYGFMQGIALWYVIFKNLI